MPPLEPDGRQRHPWDELWEKAGRSESEFNLRNCFDVAFYGDFVDWATKAKQSADEPPFKIALDLGCGIGVTTRLLQDKNPDGLVIGIDYQDSCVETARQLSRGNVAYKQTDFANGDIRDVEQLRAILAERLPSGQKPDLIVCNDTLQYFKDQAKPLADWVSLLSDDGRLVLSWGMDEWRYDESSRSGNPKPYPRIHLLESASTKRDESGREAVDMSTYRAWSFLFPDDFKANKSEFARLCLLADVQLQALARFMPRHHGSQTPTDGVAILVHEWVQDVDRHDGHPHPVIENVEVAGPADAARAEQDRLEYDEYCDLDERSHTLDVLALDMRDNEIAKGRLCRKKSVQIWAVVARKGSA